LRRGGRFQPAASNLREYAHYSADHLPDEVRPLHTHENEVAVRFDIQPFKKHERRSLFWRLRLVIVEVLRSARHRERPEVAHPDEWLRPRSHPVEIERFLHPPDECL